MRLKIAFCYNDRIINIIVDVRISCFFIVNIKIGVRFYRYKAIV